MTDIAPELWEKISAEFEAALKRDKEIAGLYEKIRSGKATYEEAQIFSQRVGRLSSMALTDNITAEALPDGKMYYNIAQRTVRPALERDYELISDASAEVQASLNKAAGIGMNPVIPEMNEDRVSGLIDKLTEDGKPFDDVRSFLEDPVMNFCQNIVDESVRANAEMHYASGLTPKIKRIMTGHKACGFCIERAGEHKYPLPDNRIYQRHENCRCLVLYDPGNGKYQDVHSKIEYKSVREAADARKEEFRQENEDKFLKKKNLARDNGEKCVDATDYYLNQAIGKTGRRTIPKKGDKVWIDGEYKTIDGSNIVINIKPGEKEDALFLAEKLGWDVELMPEVKNPTNHPNPDYRIGGKNGLFYDRKGSDKDGDRVFRLIRKHSEQADKFVINLSGSNLTEQEIIDQGVACFRREETMFVNQIILIKNEKLLAILDKI